MRNDYERLEFDPTVKEKLEKKYPKLKELFGDFIDRQMRYVILMYDINSPLRPLYPEIRKRKEWAADIAGYKIDSKEAEELYTLSINIEGVMKPNTPLLDLILKYLSYQNNRLWTLIITNEQAFTEFQQKVMSEVGGDADKDQLSAVNIKTKILESMDAIHRRLDGYYRELSGDDTDLDDALQKKKRMTAESVATR